MACLTLVAPSGMTGEERAAWVSIARQTLKDIPGDMIALGCRKAREKCRFPSEIVPTIIEEAGKAWAQRRGRIEYTQPQLPGPDPYPPVPHEETQRILKEVAASFKA